jgi:hypothetical protein
MEQYCGGHSDDETYGVAKLAGALHVAIMRKRPQIPYEEIETVVRAIPLNDLNSILKRVQMGDPPLAPSDGAEPDTSNSLRVLEHDPAKSGPRNSGSQASPITTDSNRVTSPS